MSGIVLSASVRPEPALAAVDRRLARHHAEPSVDGQESELGPRQSHQLFHGSGPRQPRQRHLEPAGRHRQRRADPAGRHTRHHLAAVAGRHPRSRSPTRRCRPRSAIPPSPTSRRRSPARPRPICAVRRPTATRLPTATCSTTGAAGRCYRRGFLGTGRRRQRHHRVQRAVEQQHRAGRDLDLHGARRHLGRGLQRPRRGPFPRPASPASRSRSTATPSTSPPPPFRSPPDPARSARLPWSPTAPATRPSSSVPGTTTPPRPSAMS